MRRKENCLPGNRRRNEYPKEEEYNTLVVPRGESICWNCRMGRRCG
ncbi:MAG: hypothetical protein ACLU4J_19460 [Butyricimonas paravirosa]